MPYMPAGLAVALVQVIHAGDVESLRRLLDEHDGMASARVEDDKGTSRTALHVAADWPGYFPNGPAVVRLLIGAGADPDAPVVGSWHVDTLLHWAASSDDVDGADALIDGGANVEAQGASIGAARRWTTRSHMAAGMWPGGWSSGAPGSTGCGTQQRWACWPVSGSFWPLSPRPRRTRSMTPSGRHAMAASAAWLNTCSPAEPI